MFTTLVYARLNQGTGELTNVNAGHNPPLLYHAGTGGIEILKRTGLSLGVDQDSIYSQGTAQMEEGDFLLFYTDGITEATNLSLEEFGMERLKQLVHIHQDCEVEGILNEIEAALLEFTAQSQLVDDVTIMGLKRSK